mgnify:CR=1 FL=1
MTSTEGVHMIREVAIRYVGARRRVAEKIASPAEAARYFRRRIHDDAREHFIALYLDGRHRAIADAIVSIGTATASLVHPREVFQPAIGIGACALLVGHNHPSGDPTPSPEDLHMTRALAAACELVGVPLLDHVVVAHGGAASVFEALEPAL